MNLFKLGTNFDEKLIDECTKLNEEFKGSGQIVEFFGSTREFAATTARPDFRLPDIPKEKIASYVAKCNANNIKFNWTFNSINPYNSKKELYAHKEEFQKTVKWLESIGVFRLTVANPMLLEFIRSVSDIELELSTIMHIDTITQMKYFHEVYGVNKLCNSLIKNRDFKFLKNMAAYCSKEGILFELLANEFCGVSGVDSAGNDFATACPYRDSCYLCHASNKTKEDALLFDNYPMNRCMSARSTSLESWLRMRWLRPQDLKEYNKIGINYFKVSGRTGTTGYLTEVIRAYMSEKYDGNLLNLWKPLETIYNGVAEKEHEQQINIPCNQLDGFLAHWTDNQDFDCSDVECGVQCTWCKQFAKSLGLTK